jgi:hypothetical protein
MRHSGALAEAVALVIATFAQVNASRRAGLAMQRSEGAPARSAAVAAADDDAATKRLHAAGRGLSEIARLNAHGVMTAHGGKWYPSSVHAALNRGRSALALSGLEVGAAT